MKITVAKANAFEIDPTKHYLLILTIPEDWTQNDLQHANEAMKERFPNISVVSLKGGVKYKIVEGEETHNE